MKLTRWDTGETIHESEHDTIKGCVEDAKKQGVSLYRIDLADADMRGANMRYADMTDANMRGADMTDADMTGANMRGADMTDANMRYANMRGADLDSSSWPFWCGSCGVKIDKENNERFAYHAMINMSDEVLAEFLQNPVEFANRFAERKSIDKIKAGEK